MAQSFLTDFTAPLDLSPLGKFMGPTPSDWMLAWIKSEDEAFRRALDKVSGITNEMYGWPITPEESTTPQPEPSPIDKALDEKIKEAEFVARRKAKRDAPPMPPPNPPWPWDGSAPVTSTERALDRAMSKLTHWESTFQDRLMPYRGGVL